MLLEKALAVRCAALPGRRKALQPAALPCQPHRTLTLAIQKTAETAPPPKPKPKGPRHMLWTSATPKTPSLPSLRLGEVTTSPLWEPAARHDRPGEPRAHGSSALAATVSKPATPKPWPGLSPGRRHQNECPGGRHPPKTGRRALPPARAQHASSRAPTPAAPAYLG